MIIRSFATLFCLVLASACSDSNNDNGFDVIETDLKATFSDAVSSNQPRFLYVQTAEAAEMTSDSTLEIPFTRDIFGFTDRPNRQHEYLTAYEFTSLWSQESDDSFSADPPNAVLTWLDGEQLREVEVIVSSATVSSEGAQKSLVYEVKLETDQMPSAQMSFASLFVDSSSQCVKMSKCNVNHSGKQCCDGGFPVGSCEASYSQDCDTTCLAEGGSVKDCANQCTTASCNAY